MQRRENPDCERYAPPILSIDGVDATLELSFVQLKPQEFEKVRRELEQKHEETGDPGEDAPIPQAPGAPAQP
ncbi:hypothetical protein ANCDUO_27729 [Ancylostoma duodenale]|uniref:Uncharacterized protein n=1 Tax=Ancylostoma duodenale TaxID=51022 RepID=A0A0C2BEX0_9BILA|nr:hypothetical protein ANCDUO_27729 [Ancylostoma duodenale]